MAKYRHDTIVPFKDSDLGKKEQVANMFDRIALRYDFLNRFLSGGIDIYWRKKAIRELSRQQPATPQPWSILDVATGTGDMAIMMTRYLPEARITGIDISEGMLELGQQKIARQQLTDRIRLQTGDSEAIHFPDNHFDAITVAFGVRNFGDLEKGLQEMRRVLKPGGQLLVLEFSKPAQPGFRKLYDLYMRRICPWIVRMLSGHREAYRYLNESVRAFPEGEGFVAILDKCGYAEIRLKTLSWGICTVYCGAKILL